MFCIGKASSFSIQSIFLILFLLFVTCNVICQIYCYLGTLNFFIIGSPWFTLLKVHTLTLSLADAKITQFSYFSAGSLFLFDRKALRYFRKDGHSWRKKKDGKTVKEAHEKLKVCCSFIICKFTFLLVLSTVVKVGHGIAWPIEAAVFGRQPSTC